MRQALQWKPVAPGKPSAKWWAVVVCPDCGKDGSLSRSVHTVGSDGGVTPSFVCPHCPFHEWVALADWPSSPKEDKR